MNQLTYKEALRMTQEEALAVATCPRCGAPLQIPSDKPAWVVCSTHKETGCNFVAIHNFNFKAFLLAKKVCESWGQYEDRLKEYLEVN